MQEVSRDLNLARIEARRAQKELEASSIFQKYSEAKKKEEQLKVKFEELQFEAKKAELEEHFECVVGHDYEDYDHKCAIVHKDCPQIVSLYHDGASWEIKMKGKVSLPREANALVLAADDSGEGAWKRAVEEWNLYNHYQKDCMLGKV